MKPEKGTFPEYYLYYIGLVREQDILQALDSGREETLRVIRSVPDDKAGYAYAKDKWTSKQLITHITDTERIMSYRALRFARRDPQEPLPFDEDQYAAHADAGTRSLDDLTEEFGTVRAATITLFRSFTGEALQRVGMTAIGPTTVNAIGYMICGHALHHCRILNERYLKN